MKTLLLLRHAKSSWDQPALEDFARPLSRRGEKAAPKMAEYLISQGLTPQLVLCSESVRTQQTWQLMSPILKGSARITIENGLYLASEKNLLIRLSLINNTVETAMVIGHNPGIAQLAAKLSTDGPERYIKKMRTKFPTAAVAWLSFEINSWQELGTSPGILNAFVRPKDLE